MDESNGSVVSEPRRIRRNRQFALGARMLKPVLATLAIFALVGLIVKPLIGVAIFLVIGCIYLIVAYAAAGHYPLDLHDGEMLDRGRAPESFRLTEEFAERLGIEPPVLYQISVEQPYMCVCAVRVGRRVSGRIGMSLSLLQTVPGEHLYVLLALGMARIGSGNASLQSIAAALAGLPLQFAQSDAVNNFPRSALRDPDCGLNAIGKALLVLFAPFARMSLALASIDQSVLDADDAVLRLAGNDFTIRDVESALRWLFDQQLPVVQDPVATFNPAEASLYLVSPFETDFASQATLASDTALWRKSRFLVSSIVPSLNRRIELLQARAAEMSIETPGGSDEEQVEEPNATPPTYAGM